MRSSLLLTSLSGLSAVLVNGVRIFAPYGCQLAGTLAKTGRSSADSRRTDGKLLQPPQRCQEGMGSEGVGFEMCLRLPLQAAMSLGEKHKVNERGPGGWRC